MRERPSKTGVYALVLRVPAKLTIQVGQLGKTEFVTGVYVYVGSAMNSLPGRISRHLGRGKKKHWHIDYLLDGVGVQPLGVGWKPTSQRIECWVSRRIRGKASASVDRFGCSDCDCVSHLHYFPRSYKAVKAISQLGFRYAPRPRSFEERSELMRRTDLAEKSTS